MRTLIAIAPYRNFNSTSNERNYSSSADYRNFTADSPTFDNQLIAFVSHLLVVNNGLANGLLTQLNQFGLLIK